MTEPLLYVIGAGRMGRGIALSYAIAGRRVALVDLKQRSEPDFAALKTSVFAELAEDLSLLQSIGLLSSVKTIEDHIDLLQSTEALRGMATAELVYEALPETMQAKEAAMDWIGRAVPDTAVVASTTSTLDVDELSALLPHPERFLNAHWLNPAHLMPLVELSVGRSTASSATEVLTASLRSIGKVAVICKASPGYIVPRIQALAMNEAARLAEEGVASVEDIDTAVRVGFGLRFAVLGLLEFIDWGGNDILYYASQHLGRTIDPQRYAVPHVIAENMHNGHNGVREGQGFYDYQHMDVAAYRRRRLEKFIGLLEHLELLPNGLERGR